MCLYGCACVYNGVFVFTEVCLYLYGVFVCLYGFYVFIV